MAKLLSASEIIDQALLHDNVDPSLFKDTFIEVTQEEHIRPILTQDLYDLIVSENDAGTFTGSNETLLNDYIKPSLVFFVMLDVVTHMSIRITNKGLMINTSETSEAASRAERLDVMTRYREMGKTMLEKMQRFIEDDLTLFPLYENGSSVTISTKMKGGIIL